MTNERAQEINNILGQDIELLKKLLEMSPEEASATLKAKGNDISADELVAFLEGAQAAMKEGELDADALDSVAGGCWSCVVDVASTIAKIVIKHW